MELDGNKRAQLVQMQTNRAKWVLFLCIRMKGVFFEDFVARLHSVGEVVLHYVMFLLRKDAWQ
jgi:hypothetical protein